MQNSILLSRRLERACPLVLRVAHAFCCVPLCPQYKWIIVAYFVGGKQSHVELRLWIGKLRTTVRVEVELGRNLSTGFFSNRLQPYCRDTEGHHPYPSSIQMGHVYSANVVGRIWFQLPWGSCDPTEGTLKGILREFLKVAPQIAAGLGALLGSDNRNSVATNQRFSVALQAGEGWHMLLSVTNTSNDKETIIIVDYRNLSIRCRFCPRNTWTTQKHGLSSHNDGEPN